MDEFRIALIGIGVFAIVGILAHGMWTIRKNNKANEDESDGQGHDAVESKIIISDDDPLLSGSELQDDPLIQGKSSLQQEDPQQEDKLSSPRDNLSAATHPETDPLVGDAPLYDSRDINTQSASPYAGQENQQYARTAAPVQEASAYDEDGIGAVRVVAENRSAHTQTAVATEKPSQDSQPAEEQDVPEPPNSLLRKDDDVAARKVSAEDIPMIDTSIEIDESPKRSGALKSESTHTEVVGGNLMGRTSESIAAKARKLVGRGQEQKSDTPARVKTPPKAPDPKKDQIRLDLEAAPEMDDIPEDTAMAQDAVEDDLPQQEVLILNVRVPEGKVIQGAALLPSLLTLGFKFGEHNMFHRHAASNGKGPRLFTLANMFNPGTFDIDNMENFNSTGVSLFMTLPIEADAHQVFNMMHNAARKLADEFGAQVLDSRRSVLTRQSLQQYVEKIREFERRRMIRRN